MVTIMKREAMNLEKNKEGLWEEGWREERGGGMM